MILQSQASNALNIQDISGIVGSISIACWIVVFTPQIFENFRRSSADGLSIVFVFVWLLGDVFNILGALLQRVQPTMTVLAIYYTVADAVLLGQCFYYRGFTLSDAPSACSPSPEDETVIEEDFPEDSPLLWRQSEPQRHYRSRSSFSSNGHFGYESPAKASIDSEPVPPFLPHLSTIRAIFGNTIAILLTCIAGIVGWHVAVHHHSTANPPTSTHIPPIALNLGGQIFGYLCAILYIGSRIPQLLLNYRRKSTEGVSVLFFLFACVGNITYVLSILAYEPSCARIAVGGNWDRGCENGEWGRGYARYMLVNASWIAGGTVTLILDLMVFGQFYIYRGRKG